MTKNICNFQGPLSPFLGLCFFIDYLTPAHICFLVKYLLKNALQVSRTLQKNVEYIVLEKINRCADCGRRLIGKTGVNPAQSRYCKGKFTAICHWETGKAQLNVEPEPGDLPVTGILHLREIGGYLHRLFIYALSREGIFILKGGLRMCKEMILVTGGARSGKSEFAERFVLH